MFSTRHASRALLARSRQLGTKAGLTMQAARTALASVHLARETLFDSSRRARSLRHIELADLRVQG